jgi:hypothetical protein
MPIELSHTMSRLTTPAEGRMLRTSILSSLCPSRSEPNPGRYGIVGRVAGEKEKKMIEVDYRTTGTYSLKFIRHCPNCRATIEAKVNVAVTNPLEIRETAEQRAERLGPREGADKPPEVGDWVVVREEPPPCLVIGCDGQFVKYRYRGTNFSCHRSDVEIVRRKDDPLQKGDGGLLDGKIEVWVDSPAGDLLCLVFRKEDVGQSKEIGVQEAWVWTDRFTLTEPVYDRKED